MHLVSFRALKIARTLVPCSMALFHSKWISNTLATGMVMQRRKHRVFNRCPRCNHWGEDRLHVVICWDQRATIIWKKSVDRLRRFMVSENTDTGITTFLLDGLEFFRRSPSRPRELAHHHEWQQDIKTMGWLNFLSGFVPESLITAQQAYYVATGSRKSGHRWAGKLINQMWLTLHQLWVGRNDVLHQKDIINKLSGEMLLDIEVEKEFEQGCAALPIAVILLLHGWYH